MSAFLSFLVDMVPIQMAHSDTAEITETMETMEITETMEIMEDLAEFSRILRGLL